MKIAGSIFLFSTFLTIGCTHKNLPGNYYHNFGQQLLLKADSTFEFQSRFDLSSSWSNGKWSYRKDTILLFNIPIYDTFALSYGTKLDTLIMSADTKAERLDNSGYISTLLSGGGQNRTSIPTKLLIKNGDLYEIDSTGNEVRNNLYDPFRQGYYSTRYYKTNK